MKLQPGLAITVIFLQACAPPEAGVIQRGDVTYRYPDWRKEPPQKSFDVAAAPAGGMADFVTRLYYPPELRLRRIGGVVLMQVSLDSTGRVLDAHVVQSVHPILDQSVIDSVRRTRWTPALKNQVPIPSTFRIPVRFTPL